MCHVHFIIYTKTEGKSDWDWHKLVIAEALLICLNFSILKVIRMCIYIISNLDLLYLLCMLTFWLFKTTIIVFSLKWGESEHKAVLKIAPESAQRGSGSFLECSLRIVHSTYSFLLPVGWNVTRISELRISHLRLWSTSGRENIPSEATKKKRNTWGYWEFIVEPSLQFKNIQLWILKQRKNKFLSRSDIVSLRFHYL